MNPKPVGPAREKCFRVVGPRGQKQQTGQASVGSAAATAREGRSKEKLLCDGLMGSRGGDGGVEGK
jgi:hypothetical protein